MLLRMPRLEHSRMPQLFWESLQVKTIQEQHDSRNETFPAFKDSPGNPSGPSLVPLVDAPNALVLFISGSPPRTCIESKTDYSSTYHFLFSENPSDRNSCFHCVKIFVRTVNIIEKIESEEDICILNLAPSSESCTCRRLREFGPVRTSQFGISLPPARHRPANHHLLRRELHPHQLQIVD